MKETVARIRLEGITSVNLEYADHVLAYILETQYSLLSKYK